MNELEKLAIGGFIEFFEKDLFGIDYDKEYYKENIYKGRKKKDN